MERIHLIHRLLIILVLTIATGCVKRQEKPSKGNKAIVSDQFEKWRNGEAAFFELLDENVIWEVSGKSPVSGVYTSKSDFMERAVNPIVARFKTPLKPELVSLSEDGYFVWLHFTAKATTLSNQLYENYYVWKMELKEGKITRAVALLDTYELTHLMENNELTMGKTIEETKEYLGMWVTEDGHIRHGLLPGNRYDEARGNRKSAYQGSYKVTGNHIDYKDDTGFTADGEFRDGILYHAGMVLYKEKK